MYFVMVTTIPINIKCSKYQFFLYVQGNPKCLIVKYTSKKTFYDILISNPIQTKTMK